VSKCATRALGSLTFVRPGEIPQQGDLPALVSHGSAGGGKKGEGEAWALGVQAVVRASLGPGNAVRSRALDPFAHRPTWSRSS